MSGEVTDSTALLQTRPTLATQLDADGDLPEIAGVACFEWSTREDFRDAQRTSFRPVTDKHDFIVRAERTGLKPNLTYYFHACYGVSEATAQPRRFKRSEKRLR